RSPLPESHGCATLNVDGTVRPRAAPAATPTGHIGRAHQKGNDMTVSSFLSQYSVQRWLEMAPQGYLEDTTWGHDPGLKEPDELLEDEERRIMEIGLTVQLVAGERCALAASSGLVNAAPDAASKTFLATQTLDEARHVEIFTRRLMDLGVAKDEIDSTVEEFANPNLVKFAETLLERVDAGDFVAGVVGQNI